MDSHALINKFADKVETKIIKIRHNFPVTVMIGHLIIEQIQTYQNTNNQ